MSENGANAELDFQDCRKPKARLLIMKEKDTKLALRYLAKTAAR
jgi:hypothetical protein